jgi:hypothetical protein
MSSGLSAVERAERKGKGKMLCGYSTHKMAAPRCSDNAWHVFHWLEDKLFDKPFMWQNHAPRMVETNVSDNFSLLKCDQKESVLSVLTSIEVLACFQ